MTSTKFNIGFDTETRNSSRVLRPPGGGHTDIFAAPEPEAIRKDNRRNASSITEGTNPINASVAPAEAPPSPVEAAAEGPKMSQEAPAPTQQRVRVPPGGFSSGLW